MEVHKRGQAYQRAKNLKSGSKSQDLIQKLKQKALYQTTKIKSPFH